MSVSEGNSSHTVSLTLTLSKVADADVTVNYATTEGTAMAARDFTTSSGTVTFAKGKSSATLDLTLLGDRFKESEETFTVTLSAPVAAELGNNSAVVTIIDDDCVDEFALTPGISIEPMTKAEGQSASSNMTFTVSLSGTAPGPVTIDYATSDNPSGTLSAIAGSDYSAASGTLTIPAASKSGEIAVSILGDELYEADELFNLTISNAKNAVICAPATVTGTILNDGDVNYSNSLGMSFKLLPAATFTMGSPADETGRAANETAHSVTISKPFMMQTSEVTQIQWQSVMGSNPAYFGPNGAGDDCGDDCPVEMVSWDDVQKFISTLNAKGEGTYSLPSEAEWEYAARAGTSTAFANGTLVGRNCAADTNLGLIGWYCGNATDTTHPVKGKVANSWGLYDMHGNVWEWVADYYAEGYGVTSLTTTTTDPTGAASGTNRTIRGGAWNFGSELARSASRVNDDPANKRFDLGLRLRRAP
ncbi:MAG: SUMF1/EgtB/PvdO family nonheme iron enzyme [Gammaproteobacteria bacterium]|nr:SUMF1/EgtB/PvdO family nonheme iron enzyme [Gammaproteobacteria bacterium]